MKNIFLIGDSIRCGANEKSPGYGVYVAEKFAGTANVYAPRDNCRFAQYTLRYLHEWARKADAERIDIVHWNNGLWDVIQLLGDEPFTPVEFYVDTLRRIHRRIGRVFPNAKVVFASSTPVVEELSSPDSTRRNRVIEAYNAAASSLMRELGVPVNDLYAVAKGFGDDLHSDYVHFGEEGCRLLADAVVRFLDGLL